MNIEPTAEDLAEIAICAAETARRFDVEPRVALLSFSNFGSTRHPLAEKVRRAVELVRQRAPELMVDGEMQADTAVTPEIIEQTYPFSTLKGGANVLIFPNLEAGNIAYKLLARIGRRGGDRADSDGNGEAGARAAARRRGERHRQYGGDRGGGRAGCRAAGKLEKRSLTGAVLKGTRGAGPRPAKGLRNAGRPGTCPTNSQFHK